MYNKFQLAKKYIHYYLTASNGKGHGVHSPFVFDFIKNVLRDKKEYDCYNKIETIRKELLSNNQTIEVQDFGAGSAMIKTNKRIVKDIAASSSKPKKYAQLLFRMVQYYKPQIIPELGTSFGISTSYLASGNAAATIYTCEGAAAIAAIAKNNFETLSLKNIHLTEGDFAKTLPGLLTQLKQIDFAFVDGNHRKKPTIEYFNQLLQYSTSSTIFVFDDIHWSKEMEEAWAVINRHPAVTLSIDLFFIGIVFFNKDFKVPQQFSIRF